MADYKFYLKDSRSEKETQIRLHIHYNNQVARVYIGEKIMPKYWSEKTRRVKQNKGFPTHPEFNERLEWVIESARKALKVYQNENDGRYPEPDVLNRKVREEIGLLQPLKKLDLFQFVDKRVKEEELRQQAEGTENQRGSYAKTIHRTGELLREFEVDCNYKIGFDTITLDFYFNFVEYMMEIKEYMPNTMGKYIKTVKSLMRTSEAEGLHTTKAYQHPKFKIFQEDSPMIFLDEDDLMILAGLNLKDKEGLERARDLLLVSSWTGLRFSDYQQASLKNIKNGFLTASIKKTKDKVAIPVHPVVMQILLKYGDEGLPNPTNQRLNRALKDLGALMKKESKVKGISKDTDKYSQITTHTGRRSFATNAYLKGAPVESIMAVTGHKTQHEFYKYLRITPEDHAKILQGVFEGAQVPKLKAN